MKLISNISTAAILAAQAHAEATSEVQTGMKLPDMMTLLLSKNPIAKKALESPNPRSGFYVQFLLNNLQGYGCWCYFDDQHGQGKGQPVDVFDTHCMKYHHMVACAKREIADCDPYDTTYQVTTSQAEDGQVLYDCETGNTPCQRATCYSQKHFISLLLTEQLEHLKVPDYPSFSTWKNGGNFDNQSCKIPHNGRPRDEMCCGTWKHNTKRLLHFGRHLSRSCCDNKEDGTFKTYDSNLATCCEDGSVRVHGTC